MKIIKDKMVVSVNDVYSLMIMWFPYIVLIKFCLCSKLTVFDFKT